MELGAREGILSKWRVPLSDVLVDEEILDAVREVIASGWWSMGPTRGRVRGGFCRVLRLSARARSLEWYRGVASHAARRRLRPARRSYRALVELRRGCQHDRPYRRPPGLLRHRRARRPEPRASRILRLLSPLRRKRSSFFITGASPVTSTRCSTSRTETGWL